MSPTITFQSKHLYTILRDDAAGINAISLTASAIHVDSYSHCTNGKLSNPAHEKAALQHEHSTCEMWDKIRNKGKTRGEGGAIKSGVDETMTTIGNVFELRVRHDMNLKTLQVGQLNEREQLTR